MSGAELGEVVAPAMGVESEVGWSAESFMGCLGKCEDNP